MVCFSFSHSLTYIAAWIVLLSISPIRFLFACVSDKSENFQPDHAALLTILRNEGVGVASWACATPNTKPYNYLVSQIRSPTVMVGWLIELFNHMCNRALFYVVFQLLVVRNFAVIHFYDSSCLQPQRVSVMKSQKKAGPATGQHCTREQNISIFSVEPQQMTLRCFVILK